MKGNYESKLTMQKVKQMQNATPRIQNSVLMPRESLSPLGRKPNKTLDVSEGNLSPRVEIGSHMQSI